MNGRIAGLKMLSSGFWDYQTVKFITLHNEEIPYVGGPLGPLKVNESVYSIQCPSWFLPDMIRITIIFNYLNIPTS
jgi:hypothetical protein